MRTQPGDTARRVYEMALIIKRSDYLRRGNRTQCCVRNDSVEISRRVCGPVGSRSDDQSLITLMYDYRDLTRVSACLGAKKNARPDDNDSSRAAHLIIHKE